MLTNPPANDSPLLETLLRSREAAAVLQISARTLWGITSPRGTLRSVRVGKHVRYDPKDIRAYIEEGKITAGKITSKIPVGDHQTPDTRLSA